MEYNERKRSSPQSFYLVARSYTILLVNTKTLKKKPHYVQLCPIQHKKDLLLGANCVTTMKVF